MEKGWGVPFVFFLVSAGVLGLAWRSLKQGEITINFITASRRDNPIGFHFLVGVEIFAGVTGVLVSTVGMFAAWTR